MLAFCLRPAQIAVDEVHAARTRQAARKRIRLLAPLDIQHQDVGPGARQRLAMRPSETACGTGGEAGPALVLLGLHHCGLPGLHWLGEASAATARVVVGGSNRPRPTNSSKA